MEAGWMLKDEGFEVPPKDIKDGRYEVGIVLSRRYVISPQSDKTINLYLTPMYLTGGGMRSSNFRKRKALISKITSGNIGKQWI